MAHEDMLRMYRLVRSLVDGEFAARKPQPDGEPSQVFDIISMLLGKNWWRTVPVGELRGLREAVATLPEPLRGHAVRQVDALIDRVEAERIAGGDAWAEATDKARPAGTAGAAGKDLERIYEAGFSAGVKAARRATAIVLGSGEELCEGDTVRWTTGPTEFTGRVLAIFTRADGVYRCVVELTSPESEGVLYLRNPNQLRKDA